MSLNVLITGNRGFLGRHFIKSFSKRHPKSKIYISNTTENNLSESLGDITNGKKLDFIYHFAAWTKAGDFCLYHPADQWIKNQKINTNILSYWKQYQPQATMVAMGTSCAYDPNIPMSAENYCKGDVDPNLYSYAMTKRMVHTGMVAFNDQYKMNYQTWIPPMLCGPDFDLEDSHFIFDLIRKIYNGKHHNEEVVLWGDGYQKREMMYVKDAVDLMLKEDNKNNMIYNLSTEKEYTIRAYAKKICDILDYDHKKIVYDTNKFVGVRSKRLEPNIKYEPTNIDFVIKEMIEYYEGKINE
jgi:GDP-L-fucose synthase|tara:strand:+ start:6717 stop:7610 length:894 start_codon:yes stop_codon:yes gene_type:complete